MKHIMFPTVSAADAFIAELQSRGVVQPQLGSMNMSRRVQNAATGGTVTGTTTGTTTTGGSTSHTTTEYVDGGGTAEDAGAGAVKGTVAGALTGAAAGVVGTAATVGTAAAATLATGGLALPVILGMAALGSGVGAAVGALGGAAGVDETGGSVQTTTTTTSNYPTSYEADDAYYNRVSERVNAGGRVVAVDDNVPQDVLMEVMNKHGGEIINA